MTLNQKIHEYVKSKRDEIVADLCDIVRIPSVSGTVYCKRVLEHIKGLYEKNGFETELFNNYLLAKFPNGEKTFGLFAHADVVEAKGKWLRCENPFEPQIIDGIIYGRGVWDNKSAVVISLYAMKLISELGLDFNSSILGFIGGSEEDTMQDVKDYVKVHTPPTFSLVLDAGFPVYLGDKGILWGECQTSTELCSLIDLRGGNATNITLGRADARVEYNKDLYEELLQNEELEVSLCDGEIHISATGISTHGATPRGSKNAGGMILKSLLDAKSFSKKDKETLCFVERVLNTYDGAVLGIDASDDVFGDTTATNGVLSVRDKKLVFTLDIRHGNSYTSAELIKMLVATLEKNGISYKIIKSSDANAISADNEYVQACMRAYKKHTMFDEAEPKINAGGTYSKLLPNSCEIGTTTKVPPVGLPNGHGFAHQPDEFISIDGLLDALEITVKMLIECDKNHFE